MSNKQYLNLISKEHIIEDFQTADRFAGKIEYRAISISPGKSEYLLTVDSSYHNPGGIVHGGALFSTMDSSQGAAITAFVLESKEDIKFMATASIEKMRFKKPIVEGLLRVYTEILERKKSIFRIRSEAFDEQNDLIAEMNTIWIVK